MGGLPYSMTNQEMVDLFSQVGAVESANIIMDRFSGRSKGFGFVEMASEDDAQKAIETLNNTEVEGRKIVVNEARPMENRDSNN